MSGAVWAAALAFASARYEAQLVRCYDGDTCTFNLTLESRSEDLGLGVYRESKTILKEQSVRLCDVDTPELRHEPKAAALARDALLDWLRQAKEVHVEIVQKNNCTEACERREKYGRWLAYLYADGVELNARLVAEGFAKPYILCRPKNRPQTRS